MTPEFVADAVDAHNTAGNAHSALFAATAKLTDLINPDSTAFAERILIGPTRAVKTPAEANRYMLTGTIGLNKGFDLVLDPGSYAGITFSGVHLTLRAADPNFPPVITLRLGITMNGIASVSNLVLQGARPCVPGGTAIVSHITESGAIGGTGRSSVMYG